ncbi:MAG: DUF2785 domain-containing protein [Hyphomonas sp.]|nr:DUF2785 domain-containing protein [Hyphomonas sp.]
MIRIASLTCVFLVAACASTAPLPEAAAPAPEASPVPVAELSCAPWDEFGGLSAGRNDAFAALEPAARHQLARDLVACLDDPDPEVRDGFAYETFAILMRGDLLDTETLQGLKADLLSALATADEDPGGFRGPFAALVLAEVARTDRIAPWMSEQERTGLIAAAADYLSGLTDYRGFSDTEGWRHGVAHTADLLMQMSLNGELTRAQGDAILAAIAGKAASADHAYIFGEPQRLAMPLFYLSRQDMYSAEEWEAWFGALWPADDPLRVDTYKSEAALRRLHNLTGFADAVYVSAVASDNEAYAPLAAGAFALIRSLP